MPEDEVIFSGKMIGLHCTYSGIERYVGGKAVDVASCVLSSPKDIHYLGDKIYRVRIKRPAHVGFGRLSDKEVHIVTVPLVDNVTVKKKRIEYYDLYELIIE